MTTKIQASLKSASEDKEDATIAKSVPTFTIDPTTIVVKPGFNSRPLNEDHVKYFMNLRRAGVDTGYRTVQMVNGERVLRDGHHRHEADMRLIAEGHKINSVKALEFKGEEKAAIFLMLATQSGLSYTPLQLGQQYVKLVNAHGMSYAEIANERGCSVQNVKDAIRLTEQPEELQSLIESGAVTSTTALKLVKSTGSGEAAAEMIKEAAKVAPTNTKAGKAKPVTQKAIDKVAPKGITAKDKAKAGKSMVAALATRSDLVKDHLRSMLESPTITGPNRDHVKAVLALCEGKVPEAPAERPVTASEFIDRHLTSDNEVISAAAGVMNLLLIGKPELIPKSGSVEAQDYGHRRWLEQMAAGVRRENKELRHAAHWFTAVLNNASRRELAPPPQVMSMEEAVRAEIDSGGAALAVELCPEAADLINYLRGE